MGSGDAGFGLKLSVFSAHSSPENAARENGFVSAERKCPRCSQELPAGSAEGLCPKCARAHLAPVTLQNVTATIPPGFPETPDAAAPPGTWQVFGDYELLEEIARGGMGVVFKARQISRDRIVAVKVIRSEWLAGSDEVRRFHVEARTASQLDHPNIVAIHEVGAVGGQQFYSMKLVEGRSLEDLARDQPLTPYQAARYVEKISLAIHYAHSRQILHRDLKPANVLVDQDDEPQVTDFGLAKVMQAERGVTMSGTVMGSPSYMPPEQARGDIAAVGVESDVYGLGAVLYELLCGRPPFRAETTLETLRQVQEQDPVAPRLLHPSLPRDLETICLKCLEKPRERRYPTALEVAADLARFQKNEPIRARPVGVVARTARWCRRKPALAGVGVTALLLLLVVAIGSPIAAFRINRARLLAEERELIARRAAYRADMVLVQEAIDQQHYNHAEEVLLSYRPAVDQVDIRNWEWRYLWEQCHSQWVKPLALHNGNVNGVSVSPDGRWVASMDDTGLLKLWSVPEAREVLPLETRGGPPPALSDDLLASADSHGGVQFWSLATLKTNGVSIQHPGKLAAIRFHSGGDRLITFGEAAGLGSDVRPIAKRSLHSRCGCDGVFPRRQHGGVEFRPAGNHRVAV